ncbi:MAG TPA: SDR family NAD(P)-dependent oxidoreductase [Thermoanaerobaculia bacterium]|nr:SDR family NAD(P)-dependent oxidoreductase [Thermoanaerobaculia bacterium]
MDKNDKPLALITGASSGIGLELAKQFARNGHDLVLVAEDGSGLASAASTVRELGGARVDTIEADLSRAEGAQRVFEEVQRLGREPDVLVNNAGVGVYGKFIETDLEEEISMINLNTAAYVRLTKFFAPRMAQTSPGPASRR